MHQLDNTDLIGRILRSVIDVISRRTSEGYAVVVISGVVKQLREKYDFFKELLGKTHLLRIGEMGVNLRMILQLRQNLLW